MDCHTSLSIVYYKKRLKRSLEKLHYQVLTILIMVLFFIGQATILAAGMRRPVSSVHPIFIFRGEPREVMNLFPEELKPYIALELYMSVTSPDAANYYDRVLYECDSMKIFAFAQVWNGWTATTIDTSWIARMFDRHPFFLGPLVAEMHGSHYDFVADCINISARYGGFTLNDDYLNGETDMLTSHSSSSILSSMRAHPDNYMIVNKQTTNSAYLKGEAIAAGLWLCGLAGNWGVNTDSWCWWETGRGKLFGEEGRSRKFNDARCWVTYPEAEVSMVLYEAAIAGATVFTCFEHPSYEVSTDGIPTPCFAREILPTLEKIVSANLIPGRDEIRRKTKAAWMAPDAIPYRTFTAIRNLYEDGSNKDWLRTTGRYGVVPVLISSLNPTEMDFFPNRINLLDAGTLFPDRSSQEAFFNNLYPPEYSGDAYAESFHGNKWYLHNSFENTNASQSATIIPKIYSAAGISLDLPPITYALLEEQPAELKIRLGNYCVDKDSIWKDASVVMKNWISDVYVTHPDESFIRTVKVTLAGSKVKRKPLVVISGAGGYRDYSYTEQWDRRSKTYILNITQNGIVDILITP